MLLALHDCDKQARKPKLTAEASMESDLLFILEHGFSQKGGLLELQQFALTLQYDRAEGLESNLICGTCSTQCTLVVHLI